jgi:hypothetical protein
MVAPFPETDTRGVKELRQTLEREAAALVPELSQSTPGEFGQAFYQLAVRMAAQLTTRLNQTAERDAIAFFDALDIPAPPPRAAEAPLVFTLAEKRDAPVAVPQGVQVGADAAGGDEVIFETTSAITLTPAHLTQLLAVDVDKDRIEHAPANVVLTAPAPGPFPRYQLATFADRGSKVIQVTPSTGLAKDDVIRIGEGGFVYRIDKIEQGLCTLEPVLEAAAAESTVIEKVIRFDAFALRDVQAHQVFIAHDELLNLKGPAFVSISITPADVVSRLSGMDIALFLWDTRLNAAGEKETDWHELTFTGPVEGYLKFHKSWQGEAEKLELDGRKSRWLKLVLRDKILNRAGIGARVNTLKLRIESDPSVPAANEQTITRAFSNNTPLSLASNFFPFGPEPLRFDTFSLAAPEALSKKGADVALNINLVDATLVALGMAGVQVGPPFRAYGVAENGRLQVIEFGDRVRTRYEEIGHPETAADQSLPTDSSDGLRLAPKPPQAIQIAGAPNAKDFVIVQDNAGRLWTRTCGPKEDSSPRAWRIVPLVSKTDPITDFLVLPTKVGGGFVAHLIVVTPAGLCARGISSAGELATAWTLLTASTTVRPALDGLVALVRLQNQTWPVLSANPSAEFILIDGNAKNNEHYVFCGTPDLTKGQIAWLKASLSQAASLATAAPADVLVSADVRAVAAENAVGVVIIGADKDHMLTAWSGPLDQLKVRQPGDSIKLDKTTVLLRTPQSAGDDEQMIAVIAPDATTTPLLAALWNGVDHDKMVGLSPPESALGRKPAAVLIPDPPYLVVAGQRECLLWLDVANSNVSKFNLFDRVDLTPPASPQPNYVLLNVDGTRRLEPLNGTDVAEGTSRAHYAIPKSSIEINKKYRFLTVKSAARAGTVGTSPDRLILDSQDNDTKKRNFVIIDLPNNAKLALRVTAVNVVGNDRVATLEANIPALPSPLSYVRATTQKNGGAFTTTAGPNNVATLARVDVPRAGTKVFVTAAPAYPAQQKIQASAGNWLVLQDAWAPQPLTTMATLIGEFTEGTWTVEPLNRGYQNPDLSWEYFDSHGWQRLPLKKDETHNLATSGLISFNVPPDLAQTDVAGQTDYWIRARLIGGDYGHAKYIVATDTNNNTQTITVDTKDLHPPEILSITATFELTKPAPAQIVLVDNNGGRLDQTQAAEEKNAEFELFEGLLALDRFGRDTPLAGRALFLGFTKPFNVSALSLYADAEEQDGDGTLQAAVLAQGGWRDAVTDDETVGLRRRGFIRISALQAPVRAALFGQELYWLRLGLTSSDTTAATDWKPKVSGLYVNAVLVDQARSITRETLGSSDGSPNKSYPLSGKPVLLRDGPGRSGARRDDDTDIELRVREKLSDEDRAVLGATIEGAKAVVSPSDLPGDWVLWRRVDSLLGAGNDDRVFTLDAGEGIVHFGDNRSGKIPPAGRDGICVFRYRQGGGVQGNVPAFAIKNLKTALESVDAAVNPIEAAGGLDAPNIERIIASAPALLRHANRAMSAADTEAFAVASSPDVVRARLVTPRSPGEAMQLAVAIRTKDAQPRPSRARAEALAEYILEHASGSLDADALKVVAPDYVPVKVRVDLLATSADAVAGVDSAVRERLARFLHPTDGGPDGDGWPFARRAWPSDIDRVLAGIAGIDRVTNVALSADNRNLDDLPPTAMICVKDTGDINVEVTTGGPT